MTSKKTPRDPKSTSQEPPQIPERVWEENMGNDETDAGSNLVESPIISSSRKSSEKFKNPYLSVTFYCFSPSLS